MLVVCLISLLLAAGKASIQNGPTETTPREGGCERTSLDTQLRGRDLLLLFPRSAFGILSLLLLLFLLG